MFFNMNKNNYQKSISKFDDKSLLLEFKNYETLNNQNRIDLLQELENREAIKFNRKKCIIEKENNTDNYGSFSNLGKKIYIDVDQDKYTVLDTYFHESKHAVQFDDIKNGKIADIKDLIIKSELAEGKNGNLYNYHFGEYKTLFSEIDANNYATNRMLEYGDLYSDDYRYYQYMAGREKYYQSLEQAINDSGSKFIIDAQTRANRSIDLISDSDLIKIEKNLPNEKTNILNNSQVMKNRLRIELDKSNEVISKKQNEILEKGVQDNMGKFNKYHESYSKKIDKVTQQGSPMENLKNHEAYKKHQEEMQQKKAKQAKLDSLKKKLLEDIDSTNDNKHQENKIKNENNR